MDNFDCQFNLLLSRGLKAATLSGALAFGVGGGLEVSGFQAVSCPGSEKGAGLGRREAQRPRKGERAKRAKFWLGAATGWQIKVPRYGLASG